MYFVQYNSAGGLTHVGTGKTVMITFDNRNLLDSTMKNELMIIFSGFFHDPTYEGMNSWDMRLNNTTTMLYNRGFRPEDLMPHEKEK